MKSNTFSFFSGDCCWQCQNGDIDTVGFRPGDVSPPARRRRPTTITSLFCAESAVSPFSPERPSASYRLCPLPSLPHPKTHGPAVKGDTSLFKSVRQLNFLLCFPPNVAQSPRHGQKALSRTVGRNRCFFFSFLIEVTMTSGAPFSGPSFFLSFLWIDS